MSSKKRYVGPVLLTSAIAGTLAMGFGGTAWAEELGVNKAAGAVSAGLSTPAMTAPLGSVPSASEVIDASVPKVEPAPETDGVASGEESDVLIEEEVKEEANSGQQGGAADVVLPGSGNSAQAEDEEAVVSDEGSADVEEGAPAAEGPSDDGVQVRDEGEGDSLILDSAATGSLAEEDSVSQSTTPDSDSVLSGWQQEGENYVYYGADGTKSSGWLVTDEAINGTSSGLQRYWLGDKGEGVSFAPTALRR